MAITCTPDNLAELAKCFVGISSKQLQAIQTYLLCQAANGGGGGGGGDLLAVNNLSDVDDVATARTNLGIWPIGVHVEAGATYTVQDDIGFVFCDAACTVTIPDAPTNEGRIVTIKNRTVAGPMVLDAPGAQTIDGELTQTTTEENLSWTVVSDGSNWNFV